MAFLVIFGAAITPQIAQADTPPAGPIYIVQQGDTLWGIALRFNVSVSDLETVNNLASTNIFAGQHLVIPGLEGLSGTLTAVTVPYGQTLHSLARQYSVDESLLRQLNHIVSPAELYAGYSLTLLQQNNQPSYTARAALAKGETLLELAVTQNTDPWTVVQINHLSGTWDALPGDSLFLPSGNSNNPNGMPPVFNSVTVDPLPVVQGTTVQVKVVSSQAVGLVGSLLTTPLHFYPFGVNTYVALQGVDAEADLGLYPLDIKATLPDGSVQSFEQMVPITSGNYLHDTTIYNVSPDTIDPKVIDPQAEQVRALTATSTTEKYWQGMFSSPASLFAAYTHITSPFGIRRSYISLGTSLTLETYHTGIDYAGGVGQPITAPAAGIVVFAGPLVVCGNATYIYHGWGVYSGICHQSAIKVTVGQKVQQGDLIGLVGGTGRALGPNLHWEVWVNGVTVNPVQWLNASFPH
ncbi:MAG: LysM peptidoglycan-binding domain-containing protein [Anaerolineales bacterium]